MALLHPEYLEPASSIWIQQSIIASGKNIDAKEVNASVQEKILDEAFIEQFTSSFDEIFSHQEIRELISFYQSKAMRKNLKDGAKLFNPIYEAYKLVIQEVLA